MTKTLKVWTMILFVTYAVSTILSSVLLFLF